MNLFMKLISDNAGKKIKRDRKAWGMSLGRLSKLTRIDKEDLFMIEKGYVCMLDFEKLMNICSVLETNPFDYFVRKLTDKELTLIVA